MTRIEHLQFLALMLPTFILLIAATISLAAPAASLPPIVEVAAAVAPMDEAGRDATY